MLSGIQIDMEYKNWNKIKVKMKFDYEIHIQHIKYIWKLKGHEAEYRKMQIIM